MPSPIFTAIKSAPGDSACDFYLAAIVIAECDSGKVDTVISHNRNIGIAVPEYQGVVGNGHRIFGRRNVEHSGGIHARIQRRVQVWQINLDPHGARVGRECLGMTGYLAGKFAPRKLSHRYDRGIAVPDEGCDILRNVCIDAQWTERCEGPRWECCPPAWLPAESVHRDRHSAQ